MAFGEFIGYEPIPTAPGAPPAYAFARNGKPPMTLMGAPAEQLRANIERSNALAPQPTAQRVQAAPGSRSVRTVSDAVAPTPGGPAAAPPPAKPTVQASAPPASIARPPGEGSAPGPQRAAPGGGLQRVGNSLAVDEHGDFYEWGGGSAKVTTEDLKRSSEGRVALPVGESSTTEGAIPQDPEYIAMRNELMDKEILSLEQKEAVAKKSAETDANIAMNLAATQAKQFQDQQNAQADIAARVRRDEEVAQKAQNEFSSARVDPGRMFKGEGGTATSIVAAIAAGLGAFGATLGRTDNFALNTINGMIDRDVSAQEAEIKIKGAAADNALSQLSRSTGSLEQGKLLLRQLQTNWALGQAEATRATAKIDEVAPQFAQMRQGLEMSAIDWNEQRRRESFGRNTATVTSQYASPQAGSSGGWRRVGAAKSLDYAAKKQDQRKGNAEIDQTEAQTVKTNAEAGQAAAKVAAGPELDAAEKKYENQLSTTLASIDNLVREYGGAIDPKTGKITGNFSFPSDIPGGDTPQLKNLKSRLTKIGTQSANASNAGAEAGQVTKDAMTPDLDTFADGGEAQVQALLTELTVAKQDWEKNKAARGGQAPAAAPAQPVDLQKE